MSMLFASLEAEWLKLRRDEQELMTACYNISKYPYPEQDTDYIFVSYYDKQYARMGFSVQDETGTAIKILTELPVTILIAFGEYCKGVQQWESGEVDYPPYHSQGKMPVTNPQADTVFDKLEDSVLNTPKIHNMDHLIIQDELHLGNDNVRKEEES
jgi:hypothetical protein